MPKTPLRLLAGLALAAILAGCASDLGGSGKRPASTTTTPRLWERPASYSAEDLRPWARSILDVENPRDAAVATLYAPFYVKADAMAAVRGRWAEEIADDVTDCLDDLKIPVDTPATNHDIATEIVTARVKALTAIEDGVPPPTDDPAARIYGDKAKVASCTDDAVLSPDYLTAGPYGRRYAAALRDNRWQPEVELAEQVEEEVHRYCPTGFEDAEGGCARIDELLAAVIPIHRRIVDANWLTLSAD